MYRNGYRCFHYSSDVPTLFYSNILTERSMYKIMYQVPVQETKAINIQYTRILHLNRR